MPPNPDIEVLRPHVPHIGALRPHVPLIGAVTSLGDSFFKSERNRLDSFGGFPNVFVDVAKLAAAGFYFTKTRDVARCVFCKADIGSWEPGDDPLSEHKRWAPHCPFLNGQEVGNMPLTPRSSPVDTSRSVDECGLYGITPVEPLENIGPLERLGITRTVTAQHPSFANITDRLTSFETWPVSLQPRPEALSAAGFFYTGQGDRCVCFQCGGGLKDWSITDDPWVEHAKFFPLCTHVIHNKGQAFITSCRPQPVVNPSSESTATETTAPVTEAQPPASQNTSGNTVSSNEASCSRSEATVEKNEDGVENKAKSGTKEETKEAVIEPLLCKICFQNEISVAFLPCGHTVSCAKCASLLHHCAVCRKQVTATFRVYLS